MIKKYIEKIVDNGKKEDMEELSNMLEEVIYYIKENNYPKYKKYKNKLMGMAYEYKFDEEMAYEIVMNMLPVGEYWNLDTINQVKQKYNLNTDLYELYVVMNGMVNDYGDIINKDDVETYVKMSLAFINDEDAVEHKVWKYFTKLVK